jgi:glycosyltransferase involved in cell wall biosynthesis
VDVLIDAFALVTQRIPDARLLLVGGGDAVSDHLERAAELGLGGAVQAFGSLSGDDLVSAYQAARVVVLPSLTEAESFGMTLIEAMACGRPVIGSAVGGIPKVIDDGVSGLLVPPGNVQELADACVRVLDDDALADRLGEFGRDRVVREFTWTPTLDRYFDAVTSSASARR